MHMYRITDVHSANHLSNKNWQLQNSNKLCSSKRIDAIKFYSVSKVKTFNTD